MTRHILERIEDAQTRLTDKGAKPALIVLTAKDLLELETYFDEHLISRSATAERRFELPPMPLLCGLEVRWSPDCSRLQGTGLVGGRIAEDI